MTEEYQMNNMKKVLEELEGLEGRVSTIQDLVKKAKSKTLLSQSISSEELELIVERIERLDLVMRDRQDVGH